MTNKEVSVELVVGSQTIILGTEQICDVIRSFPDIDSNSKIFSEFAKSPSYKVRAEVASKDNLDEGTVNCLSNDTEIEVLRELIRSQAARKHLKEEQFIKILEKDGEVASRIASTLELFENVDTQKIAELILNNDDPSIRQQLASNYSAPKKILIKLTKDSDPDVANSAKQTISR
ncbi:MAG: hypothetical protein HQM08_24000 [Candidatus Riflebacteria bacterium]|nr:hypothetical protein [Candidatus Riflebacteria bacterium]